MYAGFQRPAVQIRGGETGDLLHFQGSWEDSSHVVTGGGQYLYMPISPYSGRGCVKSLRSSYTGLYPQTRAPFRQIHLKRVVPELLSRLVLRRTLNNYFTKMCSGSEAGSYLRLIDVVYHSTLGLRVIKKRRRTQAGLRKIKESHLRFEVNQNVRISSGREFVVHASSHRELEPFLPEKIS